MNAESIINQLNAEPVGKMSSIASQALGVAKIKGDLNWNTAVLPGESRGNGTLGIFKVEGSAVVDRTPEPWSAVVKAIDPNSTNQTAGPSQHGRIELEAFAAGEIQKIETVFRPVPCLGITQSPDEISWLWLKDLSGGSRPPWSVETYTNIARGVGQFNALWPEGSHPAGAWLAEDNSTDRRADFPSRWRATNEKMRESRNPEFSRAFGGFSHDRMFTIIDDLVELIEATKQYPRSVAHNDCHTENLFFDPRSSEEIIYAVDWASVGLIPVGVDLGSFIGTGISRDRTQFEVTTRHMELSIDSYIAGLREYGWNGNETHVRVACISSIATYIFMQVLMAAAIVLHEDMEQRLLEERFKTDHDDALDQIAERFEFVMPVLDEGLELARSN